MINTYPNSENYVMLSQILLFESSLKSCYNYNSHMVCATSFMY